MRPTDFGDDAGEWRPAPYWAECGCLLLIAVFCTGLGYALAAWLPI